MKRNVNIVIAIYLILFSPCLFSQEKDWTDYRIGPNDLLEISVFGLDELNRTVRVSEEGKITLPLLGEIEVEGLTQGELENKISQLLKVEYLQNPQVSVFIQEFQSKGVAILGAVKNPGIYELFGRQTLLQIIAQAGGLTNEAGKEIVIIRQINGSASKSLKISRKDLILKSDAKQNIPLQPNDIINVPIDEIIKIYVFGQVRNPGVFEVRRSNIPTLLQAIAQAGGFSERASKKRILIKRKVEDGNELEIKINIKNIIKGKKKDFRLKENDVVIVPESIF